MIPGLIFIASVWLGGYLVGRSRPRRLKKHRPRLLELQPPGDKVLPWRHPRSKVVSAEIELSRSQLRSLVMDESACRHKGRLGCDEPATCQRRGWCRLL